jgi:protein SCO1/2
MRPHILFRCSLLAAALAIVSACGSAPDERRFTLQGQVQSLDPARKTVTVKHEEIKGFMPGMTMPYDVRETKELDGLAGGDLINATLVVQSNNAFLTGIKKVGTAPLEKSADATSAMPTASAGFELLKPGEAVPDSAFVDQDGRPRRFSEFKGSPIAITFIYTKCPLPTFCPLMDRHFAAVQKTLETDASLRSVHLVTVSFDPITDTPPVLKAHAKSLDADFSRWTFLTGNRDDIDQFASHFGVQVSRALNDPKDITHNLRTAIVDADGRLVKTYTGNEWTPGQLLTDLRSVSKS